jgi:hypothetical protein
VTGSEEFFGTSTTTESVVAPETQPMTVDQPSKFPTPKVAAATGVPLVLYQVFDVIRDLGVNIIQSARELVATVVGGIAAWFVKEYRERRRS